MVPRNKHQRCNDIFSSERYAPSHLCEVCHFSLPVALGLGKDDEECRLRAFREDRRPTEKHRGGHSVWAGWRCREAGASQLEDDAAGGGCCCAIFSVL